MEETGERGATGSLILLQGLSLASGEVGTEVESSAPILQCLCFYTLQGTGEIFQS